MSNRPDVSNSDFRKVLKHYGLRSIRTSGGHAVYDKKSLLRPVIFRTQGNIPIMHIKTNCKTLGITPKEFFQTLEYINRKKKPKK